MPSEPLIQLRDVHLAFADTPVLRGIDLDVQAGQAVSIIGPSGSGKSTILRCMTGLLRPQHGSIRIGDTQVERLRGEAGLIALRKQVGFVFQQYNLFPHLSVLDNLLIAPTKVLGRDRAQARDQALALLDKVRLGHKAAAFRASCRAGSSSG